MLFIRYIRNVVSCISQLFFLLFDVGLIQGSVKPSTNLFLLKES